MKRLVSIILLSSLLLCACVWFEVLTGRSCIGNTFRPEYKLSGLQLDRGEDPGAAEGCS